MIEYRGKELWTYFFNKPKAYYNKYMFEMINYENYLYFDNEEIISYKGKWSNLFANNSPIYLEIGSGSGNFAVEFSYKNPSINIIGDELRLKRLVTSSRKASNLNLKNIKFIRYDANHLENIFKKDELDAVIINFPDPWDNEEHKRILSNNLLDTLKTILKDGGKIYFKTDHLKYYEDVLDIINKRDDYSLIYHSDDYISEIKTEFENLFINKLKIKIKYIEIIKLG